MTRINKKKQTSKNPLSRVADSQRSRSLSASSSSVSRKPLNTTSIRAAGKLEST